MAKVKSASVPAPAQSDWEDVDSSEWEDITPSKPDSSAMGSAARGFTDVSTLGYAPQIAGALDPLAGWLAKKIDPGVAEQIKSRPYVEARDEYNQQLAEDASKHRMAQLLGKGAGLAANVAIPVGMFKAAGPGAWNAAKVGAKTGALYGGLSNPGDTEGQIDPLQLQQRAKGAGIGALLGGGMGAAGSKLADWFKRSSQRQAVKSLNASPETEAELQIMGAGKTLQEQGLMGNPLQSSAELQEKIARNLPQHAQAQKAMLEEASRRGATIDAAKVAEEAQAGLKQPAFASQEASMAPVARDIESTVEMVANPNAIPLQRAQDIKAGFQSKGFETAPSSIKTGDTFTSEAYKAAQGPYREAIEQAVAQSGAGDIAAVNQTMQHLISVQNAMKSGGISANQAVAQLLRNPPSAILRMLRAPAFRASIEPKLAAALEKAVSPQGQATLHRAANTGRSE